MAERITFTEFAEYVLARLYDLDGEVGGAQFHDVRDLANELKASVPESWPADVVTVLENRGLVHGIQGFGGVAQASIKGEGRLFVEEREHEAGIIKEYRERPHNVVIVSGTGHQVAVATDGYVSQTALSDAARSEVFALLGQIEDALLADEALAETERADALADVEAAGKQLERRVPNKKAAIALLEPLSKLSAVGGFVIKVIEMLG